jgi:RNA polymerase sigma factor (sigma-70 family)
MKELTPTARYAHPLVDDRARLERIADNMYAQIQRVLHGYSGSAGARAGVGGSRGGAERVLSGGESVDDVLQEALIALLEFDPAKVHTSWEALSVGIARKKAFTALRRATRGRLPDSGDGRDAVSLVPLDAGYLDGGQLELRDESLDGDPEVVFERTHQQLVLLRLARERLTGRERTVFFGIHFEGATRAMLADQVGLTPQAVGQMYVRLVRSLYDAALADPAFPSVHAADPPRGGPGGPVAGASRGNVGRSGQTGAKRTRRGSREPHEASESSEHSGSGRRGT